MEWNGHSHHDRMRCMTESELLVYLRQHGYVLCLENFPFGRMLMFADVESGVKKWYFNGALLDWPQVAQWLRETWTPVSPEDIAWAKANL